MSTAHSGLFDETALAAALTSGRIAAAWFDSLEPGALDPERPLHGIQTLQVTPRVAATTREARQRSAWAVARRIDELLEVVPRAQASFSETTIPGGLADLEAATGRTEFGDPLLDLSHHLGRRPGDEALVAELGVLLGDLGVDAVDLLGQPGDLGRAIDLDVQRDPARADDGDR